MKNNVQINKLIGTFSGQGNIITFPKIYFKITKDVNAAIVLNQIVYWSDRTKRTDGFFYKTYKEWNEEILLTQYQVKNAVDKLIKLKFVETKLHRANGAPTVHYRANIRLLTNSIIKELDNQETSQSIIKELNNPLSRNLINHYEETKQTLTDDYTDDYTEDYKGDLLESEFEEWWNLYDKKIDKKKAKQKFKLCRKKHSHKEIMEGTKEYLNTITDKKYQKHATTFLNGESYLDIEGYKKSQDYDPHRTTDISDQKLSEKLGFRYTPPRMLTEEEREKAKKESEGIDF